MNLCDTVRSFAPKITENCRDTRYCGFAPPEETVGIIDLSTAEDGSRGIAFLTDRLLVKLGSDVQQLYYSDIRILEILPSYETPFEDELLLGSPAHKIRISDCSLNKFFLRQLISNITRISAAMTDNDREALSGRLTAEALDYYAGNITEPEQPPVEAPPAPSPAQEAPEETESRDIPQPLKPIDIPEEKIDWLSAIQPDIEIQSEIIPEKVPDIPEDEDITDMTREQAISFLLDSIAEINSDPETEPEPEPEAIPELPPKTENTELPPEQRADIPPQNDPVMEQPAPYTMEPDNPDIYIKASRRIRELCEKGTLSMEQVNAAVREQLVPASELFSTLDIENAPLPPTVKAHALCLSQAADRLPEYFRLGEDIAARVMFFMLYQMLSYTDRIVQSDETKQQLNYFFIRFSTAGMILSMLDANEDA
ncbi:MAG: hypothetical protein ACI4WS_01855 [Oscillospiraceae bacterium]